jgi:hypothetical protein
MGIFAKLKQKLFGTPKPIFKPFRTEEQAAAEVHGQVARRRKLLERRVKSGESEEVYKNSKILNTLSTGLGAAGDSPLLEAFLDGYPLSRFASSNVWSVVYDRKQEKLHVQYMAGKGRKKSGPGTWYGYKQVTVGEAKTIFNAASKGVFVWSNLRVRGTKNQNKKPTTKNDPPPSYLPLGRKRANILQSP